jgi:hypothetical protein
MRSFASYGMYIWGLGFSVLDNLIIDSDGAIGVPLSGIMAPSGANVFRNGKITGTYSVAALDCNNAKSNCYYTYEVTCSGPGVVYRPLASTNSNDLPNFFINCSFDTGQNIANIPSTPGWKYRSLLCNDSTVPVWDSTLGVSNVGAPFLGSGTNKVLVAYNGFNWYVVG